MKVLIIYHSGAGSTQTVARVLGRVLESMMKAEVKSISLTLKKIKDFDLKEIENADLVCFGSPTYALEPSQTMKDFLERLPELDIKEKPALIFTTYGLYDGAMLKRFAKSLEQKGFRIVSYLGIKAPGSDGALMFPEFLNRLLKVYQFEKNAPLKIAKGVMEAMENLKNGSSVRVKDRPTDPVYRWLLKLEKKTYEKYKNGFWIDPSRCTNCEVCVKICPREAWKSGEKIPIHESLHCELCLKCIHHCPENAIGFSFNRKVLDRRKLNSKLYREWEEKLFAETREILQDLRSKTRSSFSM